MVEEKQEKYYLGKVSSENGRIHSLMIYDNTLQLLADAAKALFANDPLYNFEEKEISKKQFEELEEKLMSK